MWKQLIDWLGFGSAFALAAGTYGLFLFFDKNVSPDATSALSRWLKARGYRNLDARGAILNIFNKIYTEKLFGIKGFSRSGVISVVIFLLSELCFARFSISKFVGYLSPAPDSFGINGLYSLMVSNIVSDYISLFVIKAVLQRFRNHLITSVVLASVSGVLLVTIIFISLFVMFIKFIPPIGEERFLDIIEGTTSTLVEMVLDFKNTWVFTTAVFVYIWLPLIATGALGFRLFVFALESTNSIQWLIKEGDVHPLRAIGLMAASFVFIATAIVQVAMWWW